jgi:hypothetical protein
MDWVFGVVSLLHNQQAPGTRARPRWTMGWVWQCPVMMSSWSWVLFYAGLVLHILTPVIPRQPRSKSQSGSKAVSQPHDSSMTGENIGCDDNHDRMRIAHT